MPKDEAWFEATNLVVTTGSARLTAPSISVATAHLALLDRAAELLPLLPKPARWMSGRVTLGERPLSELLASGEAGYAPAELPGDERLGAVLETSATLIGASRADALGSAARLGLGHALRTRLSRLSRVDLRLGGLAHALTTRPRFLLLEDLLVDLEPHEADRVELGLDAALCPDGAGPPRAVLFACHSRSKRSFARLRSLRARREDLTVLTAKGECARANELETFAGPAATGSPADYLIRSAPLGAITAKSVYIEFGAGEAPTFARHAAERGLAAAPLPGGHLVLVGSADQERALELAKALGLGVARIEEAHFGS